MKGTTEVATSKSLRAAEHLPCLGLWETAPGDSKSESCLWESGPGWKAAWKEEMIRLQDKKDTGAMP